MILLKVCSELPESRARFRINVGTLHGQIIRVPVKKHHDRLALNRIAVLSFSVTNPVGSDATVPAADYKKIVVGVIDNT